MPAYCDVCGRPGNVFWSNYENWWNPKIYCSFTCSAAGSWGFNLIFAILSLIWTLAGGPLGFFTFLLSIILFILAYFGKQHANRSRSRSNYVSSGVSSRYQKKNFQDDISEYIRMTDN